MNLSELINVYLARESEWANDRRTIYMLIINYGFLFDAQNLLLRIPIFCIKDNAETTTLNRVIT